MVDGTLNRLLKVEKEANSIVEEAREQASKIVEKAEEDARDTREKKLEDFRKRSSMALRSAEEDAQKEAEKIKRDGIELARGLSKKSETRIPDAVEEVLRTLLEELRD